MDPQWLDPELSRELGDVPATAQPATAPAPAMLDRYLDYLYEGGEQWPQRLVVPDQIRVEFGDLFQIAEQAGAEHGYALFYDRKTQAFSHGKAVKGNSNSINPLIMEGIGSPNCFGYIHAHPSASIGHVGGYSPQSVEDLLTFEYWASRGQFFQFVVSGPRLYILIYIKGTSKWDDAVKSYLGKRLQISQAEAEELLFSAAGGREAWAAGALEIDAEPDAAEQYRRSVMAKKPDFGKCMEDIAMRECKLFAQKYNYAFVLL
jgi:hypothetical protein